jgi:hypothetical protein
MIALMLDFILQDTHALEDEMRMYDRKYDVMSETFHESHRRGKDHPDDVGERARDLVAALRHMNRSHLHD